MNLKPVHILTHLTFIPFIILLTACGGGDDAGGDGVGGDVGDGLSDELFSLLTCEERGFEPNGVSTKTSAPFQAGYGVSTWTANCVDNQLTDYPDSTDENPHYALSTSYSGTVYDEQSQHSFSNGVYNNKTFQILTDPDTGEYRVRYGMYLVQPNGSRRFFNTGMEKRYDSGAVLLSLMAASLRIGEDGYYEQDEYFFNFVDHCTYTLDGLVLHGLVECYRTINGQLDSQISFEFGVREGISRSYSINPYTGENFVSWEAPYVNGVIHGIQKIYAYTIYGDIYLAWYDTYVNGFKEGIHETYWPGTTQVDERWIYVRNKLHGPYVSYYSNGIWAVVGQYTNDAQSGEWKYYDDLDGYDYSVFY